MRLRTLAAAIVAIAAPAAAQPTNTKITVPTDAPTIQQAIDLIVDHPDSVIEVLPGTYNESFINLRGKAFILRAASNNGAATTINAPSGAAILATSGEQTDTIIEGLTFTNAVESAIRVINAGPTIRECNFINNRAGMGGAIFNDNASTQIIRCTFHNNSALNQGGAVFNAGGSTVLIVGSLFNGNTAPRGAAISNNAANFSSDNCTFSRNMASPFPPNSGGAILNDLGSFTTINNAILWENLPNEITNAPSSTVLLAHSDIRGGIPPAVFDAGGNISINPMFLDPAGPDGLPATPDDNLRLSPGSPCIDAGTNLAPGLIATPNDLDDQPRFADDPATPDTGIGAPPVVDMGAYEFQPSIAGGMVVNLNRGTTYPTIQDAIDDALDNETIQASPGTYNETINLKGKAITLRSASGAPANTTIDASNDGPAITCNSAEGPDTRIIGFTIARGSASLGGGISIIGASPTIECCRIIDCTASVGGAAYVASASPTFSAVAFIANTATAAGGALYLDGATPTIASSLFSGNTAPQGAALAAIAGGPQIAASTFTANDAAPGGSALYISNARATRVSSSIFWNNNAIPLTNGSNDKIPCDHTGPLLSFSNVQDLGFVGFFDAGGIIDADPRFMNPAGPDSIPGTPDDDLRLRPGSPSIDAGDNTEPALNGALRDLAKMQRFRDDTGTPDTGNGPPPLVDHGAYEFQGTSRTAEPRCVADLDADNDTDVMDFNRFAADFGKTDLPLFSPCDLDNDTDVDVLDFVILANDFGCRAN